MSRYYLYPEREREPYALPDVEVFYAGYGELTATEDLADGAEPNAAGFYYWFCFPGCMPDSEPDGPYETEEAALEACRALHGD